MSRPKIPQAKRTYLLNRITASETTEIKLNRLQDIYGNNLAMTDFGDVGYITINPGTDNAEVISFTGFTVNADNSVSIDTGIVRGLAAVSPYGAGGTAKAQSNGSPCVVSNSPHWYEALLDYMDGLVLAGAPDAAEDTAGVSEEATTTEINADTGEGGTTRRLFVNPQKLASSKYGLRLPSETEKEFLGVATGAIVPYAGNTAPTGWLECDGQEIALDTYPTLAAVLLGRYGLGTGTEITNEDTGTDVFTAVSHGLSDGDIVMVYSDNTLPAGLSANTLYYVINSTTNTFQLSTSSGGAAVNITTTGTGAYYFVTTAKVPNLKGSTIIGKGQKVFTYTFEDADVNTSTEEITVDSNSTLYTGQAVALTTSGVLPTGLSATTYYVIRVNATTIKLATSVANANYGTAVNITAASGGGTHTLTQTFTSRTVGQEGGTETDTEVAAHYHDTFDGSASGDGGSSSDLESPSFSGTTGGNTPNNMPPFVVANWLIKT